MFGSLWCDLSVWVVFGVISLFSWGVRVIWKRLVFLRFFYKLHGFKFGKEIYVSVNTRFSSALVFLVIAVL